MIGVERESEDVPEIRKTVEDCQERTWRPNEDSDVPCVAVEYS